MTIRRDVERLARDQLVRRVHGGVTTLSGAAMRPSAFADRTSVSRDEKRAIAVRALDLVRPGANIGIDSGTTAYQLALLLPPHLRLTVATHSLPALVALAEMHRGHVIALGGELHPETQDFASPATWDAISHLRLSMLFLATGGISDRGVYCASYHEALVKRHLIEVADRVVLLADSSKFATSAMVRVCDLEDVDVAVVDGATTTPQLEFLVAHGIEPLIAPPL